MIIQTYFKNIGFTLIEILVSLVIFSMVLLGAVKGYLLVENQMKQLGQKKNVISLVQELMSRRYRNPKEVYFEQSVWDLVEKGSLATGSELRDEDIRWFQAAVHGAMEGHILQNSMHSTLLAIKPCAERYICLAVSQDNQLLMSFIVARST